MRKVDLNVQMHFYSELLVSKKPQFITAKIDVPRGGFRIAATSKVELFVIILTTVNYYHKELHLGCCSRPKSGSGPQVLSENNVLKCFKTIG